MTKNRVITVELVRCKKDVVKKLGHDFVEIDPPKILFKADYFYPAFQDQYGTWLAADEEGEAHVISEAPEQVDDDPWFELYFKKV
ncbi:hypothetical protein [Salibacterium halotolerans]|uniref:Uncharacterized protein n=1 Tax=Salibacterium halotolerans TaxID=1884432 RepID=A0A1I5UIT4_9BACI|nr:hypothetical protein [Salibacterium halotolerans]SFP95089.1 hypothetical protein SAMN05518683_11390 [Salibacterium halotolerans]